MAGSQSEEGGIKESSPSQVLKIIMTCQLYIHLGWFILFWYFHKLLGQWCGNPEVSIYYIPDYWHYRDGSENLNLYDPLTAASTFTKYPHYLQVYSIVVFQFRSQPLTPQRQKWPISYSGLQRYSVSYRTEVVGYTECNTLFNISI